MRDRLKRRKKPPETKGSEPAPPPLQPDYYEAPAPAPPVPEEPSPSAPEPEPGEAAPSSGPALTESGPRPAVAAPEQRRRRRRRGRGGRGRGEPHARAETQPEPAPVEPEPTAPPIAVLETPRPPKGVVVLAIGLPGSGKSSWFKRNSITPLSSDLVRSLLFDNPEEQRFQDLVFSNLRSMLKARLIARRPMNYVDATNLSPHERHGWIKLAKDYGYEVQAVFFDVPLEVCLERNRKRQRVVDEEVMRRMAAKLRPPTFEEGFSKVTVVRVKTKPIQPAN
jgi:predicted kinase